MRGNKVLRLVDRYAGVPAVMALAVFRLGRRRRVPPLRRIGLMKTLAIGDTVLLSGVVEDIRAQYPRATIVFMTGEDNRAVAEMMMRDGDEHVVVSPRKPVRSVVEIRNANVDVLLDFGAWPRFDAILSALSGAKLRVGFRTPGQHRHFAYDLVADYSAIVHEVDNNRRIAAIIGVDSRSAPRITPPHVIRPTLPGDPYVVFHPWAAGTMYQAREWPADRWVELARRTATMGVSVVLSGSSGDRANSANLERQMLQAGIAVDNAAGRYSLREMTYLLAKSRAMVSVNTGIMHLAAAVGTPTVGLHGPTASRRWGPLGRHTRSVDSEYDRCGYLNLGWEYRGQRLDCMAGVTVEQVARALGEVMASAAGG
jgi:heptosyltransferase III